MKKFKRVLWNLALFAFLTIFVFGTFHYLVSQLPESPEVTAFRAERIARYHINHSFEIALIPYRLDIGSYPSSSEGLNALIQPPKGKEIKWKGPYLDELLLDPWGNPYQYRYPGLNKHRKFDLFSYGPDGIQSADDICNWEEARSYPIDGGQ